MEETALGNAVLATKCAIELGIELVNRYRCEEPEIAEIDSEQRNVSAGYGACRGKQRAVPAEDDHELAAFRHFLTLEAMVLGDVQTCLLVVANVDLALPKPLDQRRDEFGRSRDIR